MKARSETYPTQYYINEMTLSTPSFISTMNSFNQSITDDNTKHSNLTNCMNFSNLEKLVSQLTVRISKVEMQLKTNYDIHLSSPSSRLDGKISNMSLQLAEIAEARQTYANALLNKHHLNRTPHNQHPSANPHELAKMSTIP